MTTGEDAEVVLYGNDILIQQVGCREAFRTKIDGAFTIFQADRGEGLAERIAVIPHNGCADVQLVGNVTAEDAAQLQCRRVGRGGEKLGAVDEVDASETRIPGLQVFCLDERVTQRKFVVLANVPVNFGQELITFEKCRIVVEGTEVVIVLFLNLAAELLNLLQVGISHIIVEVERLWRIISLQLGIDKEEEFIFDNRAAQAEAVGFSCEFRQPLIGSDAFAGQHFISPEVIGRALEFVGAAAGYRVDGAAGETTLADVERRNRYCELFDGIDRYGLYAGLSAVGAGPGQAEGVVVNPCVSSVIPVKNRNNIVSRGLESSFITSVLD